MAYGKGWVTGQADKRRRAETWDVHEGSVALQVNEEKKEKNWEICKQLQEQIDRERFSAHKHLFWNLKITLESLDILLGPPADVPWSSSSLCDTTGRLPGNLHAGCTQVFADKEEDEASPELIFSP